MIRTLPPDAARTVEVALGEDDLVTGDLIRAIGAAVGRDLAMSGVVSARRGATVAQLRDRERAYALKVVGIGAPAADAAYAPAELLRREARHLRALGDFTANCYVASGGHADRMWLLTRWLDAQDALVVTRRIRRDHVGEERRQHLLAAFLAMLRKLRDLHARGYVHGDLQPAHFAFDAQEAVHLLDFALAKRLRGDHFAYRGGLVHFNAPEVCAALLERRDPIPLDPRAEVYSAAAVIFFLYTGRTAADYGTYAHATVPMIERLRRIADGHRNTFARVEAEPFPALERVLEWCLQVERRRRCPGLAQAIDALNG